jgi:phage terminase small subunit
MEQEPTPKPPHKRKGKLTPRQNRLVKNLAKGMSGRKAAIASGYSPKGAAQTAHKAMQAIEKKAGSLLERNGLDEDSLVENYLKPMLSATEQQAVFTRRGWEYSKEMPAHSARNKAMDTAFKIAGSYKADQDSGPSKIQVVIVNNSHRPPWEQQAAIEVKPSGNGHASPS